MDSYGNNWWAPSNFIQYHAQVDISSWQDIHLVRYSKSWICWVHWLIPATYVLGYSFKTFGSTNSVLENWHFPFLLQNLMFTVAVELTASLDDFLQHSPLSSSRADLASAHILLLWDWFNYESNNAQQLTIYIQTCYTLEWSLLITEPDVCLL
jgi:hypothetical protein